MAQKPIEDPTPSPAPEIEAQIEQAPEGNNIQVLYDRIASLEGEVLNLQGNLAAHEATTQLAVDSENFMLAELQKASEQLLCKPTNFASMVGYSTV